MKKNIKENWFEYLHWTGAVVWFFVKIPDFILKPVLHPVGLPEIIASMFISFVTSILWELCLIIEIIAKFYLKYII